MGGSGDDVRPSCDGRAGRPSATGLPIGVQIIGSYLGDRTTIAFAGLLEREFGGFVRPPLP
jgi:Asp-tRNA(Asn)/Glu-tRNA(Gln) amidotransferase A subunit family amidase